jgi:hypothetical protein
LFDVHIRPKSDAHTTYFSQVWRLDAAVVDPGLKRLARNANFSCSFAG